ncbi:MAG: PQQ-dependent sugar dehydrogenase [Anaerolineae bacterium]
MLALPLILAACGGTEPPPPTEAAVVASPLPGDTATARPPSATPTETPSPTPQPSDTSTPQATVTGAAPATTAPPVTVAPSATPPPTATPTQPPTATPSPPPTATTAPTATPTPPPDPAAVRLELQAVAGGLEVPVAIAHAGDGSGRLFVVEKPGRIRLLRDGALAAAPFLDLTDRVGAGGNEQGLLGLAFHPRYAQNGLFYVNYTDRQGDTVVARFALGGDPDRADPASESVILTLDQPAANHNGGHLAFGPDGYLYVGTGDGGASGDRYGNGQNGATLLGAMLRLDVDGGQPYTIPPGNPFVGDPAVRDEIWAVGLRNPWRYSFDRATGGLYIADVGQNQYEEVNFQPPSGPGGQNYGWPIMEGQHCYPADQPCEQAGLVLPVAEYDHSQGCSVTGGYVYRGAAYPRLRGIYLYGDYCSGRIWGLARDPAGGWRTALLAETDVRPTSFGQDEAGELYLVDGAGGALYRLAAVAR